MGLLAAACGAGTSLVRTSTQPLVTGTSTARATPSPRLNPNAPVPTPGPTGARAPSMDVELIRAWSDALRRGDVRAAARYFALPSVMVNGSTTGGRAFVIAIDTFVQAEAANATLPCGARLISADQRGRFVNALFRLTGRSGLGGSNCGGVTGVTARTNFVIAQGRIVEWIRAPDDPGDNGTPRVPANPPPPSQPSGPLV